MHVVPRSTQITFPGQYNPWRNSIEIKVQSEAKENKANTETIKAVAGFFQLSVKDVALVSGEKKREKTVCLKNISIRTVNAKLEKFFHG